MTVTRNPFEGPGFLPQTNPNRFEDDSIEKEKEKERQREEEERRRREEEERRGHSINR